ncbi:TadE/TadG family type IV pilus assembly protein [Celeribacter indicus]|uniref:VWFA domain-containing protein n=1 Tax=Celeribacter indicus TaxID=1208324 RepID=A0A0B5E4S9_9RHOB|nr:TadE/TadG family type IV pilus assembly protein [Celeribacter indicus]AJE48031.1 hypothetical protein P73_3316 [Celeribacter indicus]SDW30007.1 Flp pilus assembly protein TadG [Celeribacter indicus]
MLGNVTRREAAPVEPVRQQGRARLSRYKLLATMRAARRAYWRDEDGALFIFGLFAFVIILMVAGMGVDVIRHETLRTQLQGTLDRSILVAANIQTQAATDDDVKNIVLDYFDKAGFGDYISKDDIDVTRGMAGRRVSATVDGSINTFFMRLAGVDDIGLSAAGTAEQSVGKMEIALVLDVSGSMDQNHRIANLRDAADDFAKTIFSADDRGQIALSIVPYSGQVNAGPSIGKMFNRGDPNDYSYCLQFDSNDFKTISIQPNTMPGAKTYPQAFTFDAWNDRSEGLELEYCDSAAANEILPFVNSYEDARSKIRGLRALGGTSINIGLKWGTALLDPSFRPITASLEAKGKVSSTLKEYPLDFPAENDSAGTQKIIVLMTDGEHDTHYFIKDKYRRGNTDAFVSPEGVTSFKTDNYKITEKVCTKSRCRKESDYETRTRYETRYYIPSTGKFQTTPAGGNNATPMEWADIFARYTTPRHEDIRIRADNNGEKPRSSSYAKVYDTSAASTKDRYLEDLCTRAKDAGIIIYSIGFETTRNAKTLLKSCATTYSHYYDVEGIEISEAFSAIAAEVTELRLTQ